MVKVSGVVTHVSRKLLTVRVMREEMCGQCPSAGVCRELSKRELLVDALNECDVRMDDLVCLELRTSTFLKASFVAYGVPLLLFFIFALGGYFIGQGMNVMRKDILSALCGLGGVVVGYVLVAVYNRRESKGINLYPRAVTVVDDNLDELSETSKET
ncbi:MAG: SoxR reducing system RseC family protein [Methermicoccaceae archaeon]